jgi:hypothetical protein
MVAADSNSSLYEGLMLSPLEEYHHYCLEKRGREVDIEVWVNWEEHEETWTEKVWPFSVRRGVLEIL